MSRKQKIKTNKTHVEMLKDIKAQFGSIPSSGTTLLFPGQYPKVLDEINIPLRNKKGLLGTTLTNPDGNNVHLGVSFENDRKDKEDVVIIKDYEIDILHKGEIEKVDSRYKQTHHGNKDYLRKNQKKGKINYEIIYKAD